LAPFCATSEDAACPLAVTSLDHGRSASVSCDWLPFTPKVMFWTLPVPETSKWTGPLEAAAENPELATPGMPQPAERAMTRTAGAMARREGRTFSPRFGVSDPLPVRR
jgi:hypothetical protein